MRLHNFQQFFEADGAGGGVVGGEAEATVTPATEPDGVTDSEAENNSVTNHDPKNTAQAHESQVSSVNAAVKPNHTVLAETQTDRGVVVQLVRETNGRQRIVEVPIDKSEIEGTVKEQTPDPQVTGVEKTTFAENSEKPLQELSEGLQGKNEQEEQKGLVGRQPISPQPYTADEMTLAIQLGIVDESRIPANLAIQYGQYKERMAQQQALANSFNRQQEENAPQQDEASRKLAFLEEVEKTARDLTLRELNLKEEDISSSEYADYSENPDLGKRVKMYNSALAYNRQRIINDIQSEAAKGEQQQLAKQNLSDRVNAFVQKEIQVEPRFNEIDAALLTHYKTLPFDDAQKYYNAIMAFQNGSLTEDTAKDLQEYYETTKKAVYAKANNLSTTPQPVVRRPARVESPGTGLDIKKQANPEELRGLNYREKLAWFKKNM